MGCHWRGGSFGGILNQSVVGMLKIELPWFITIFQIARRRERKLVCGVTCNLARRGVFDGITFENYHFSLLISCNARFAL